MIHEQVKEYYGKKLETSSDLKTNACKTAQAPTDRVKNFLKNIHPEVQSKYYGCGLLLPEFLAGVRILDLGSGSGRDCFLLSQMVGENGSVVGVDMTDSQLAVANKHLETHREKFGFKKSNVIFHKGYLEKLNEVPLKDSEFDVVISNCVINLVEDKKAVLLHVFNLLKEGGEFYFSDIYSDRRISSALKKDSVLYGECLSGAMYWNDFHQLARSVGFADLRVVSSQPIEITDPKIKNKLGSAQFYSVTYRLFKIADLEFHCEDYGQAVQYKGTIEGQSESFDLDEHHHFESGKIQEVCGNTYLMLQKSRLKEHFKFYGDFEKHYGVFSGCGTEPSFSEGCLDAPSIITDCC